MAYALPSVSLKAYQTPVLEQTGGPFYGMGRWGEAVARLREPVRRAECAVLFFPVAVTVLAAVALLCGGRVAAW